MTVLAQGRTGCHNASVADEDVEARRAELLERCPGRAQGGKIDFYEDYVDARGGFVDSGDDFGGALFILSCDEDSLRVMLG